MNKIVLALKSRTFWTIVLLFVINGVSGIHDSIPANYVTIVDTVLSLLATYFHVSPRQSYNS